MGQSQPGPLVPSLGVVQTHGNGRQGSFEHTALRFSARIEPSWHWSLSESQPINPDRYIFLLTRNETPRKPMLTRRVRQKFSFPLFQGR
jgi:hypothetical protein